jgi:nucleoside-diphosphate-sugar epimerase
MLGSPKKPRYAPPRAGDVRHSMADIAAARALLGFEPKVDFVTGLRRTVEWYRTTLSVTR